MINLRSAFVILIFCLCVFFGACENSDILNPGGDSNYTGGDVDSDGDSDTDGDGDSDGDTDSDTDTDTDTDSDTDADTDADSDADGDTDTGDPGSFATCLEAQSFPTNEGCKFWAVDLPQAWWGENGAIAPADGPFAVAVANTSTASEAVVTIYSGNTTTVVDQATVPISKTHTFNLPAQNINARQCTDTGLAYRIESDRPVTAYQFNTLDQTSARFSADASLLFPTHVLSKDYTAITGDAFYYNALDVNIRDSIGAFISVVAEMDNTKVDIYPPAGVTLMSGVGPQGVVINRGEVYTILSTSPNVDIPPAGTGNLSGARIQASKKVAVFTGNVASFEPTDKFTSRGCCGDHMEQQMLPLESWGKNYAAGPPLNPNNISVVSQAGYRLIGGFDSTSLTYSPSAPSGAPATVSAYETVFFATDQSFTVSGTQPFGLVQFHPGAYAYQQSGPDGDPAMVLLQPADQYRKSYVFLTPPTYRNDHVTVIRPVSSTTKLDNVTVTESVTSAGKLNGTDYEVLQIPVFEGSHRITGTQPFGITAYGYHEAVGYAYPGGTMVEVISQPPVPPQ